MKVSYINLVDFNIPRIPEIGDEDFAVFDEVYDSEEEWDEDFDKDEDEDEDEDFDYNFDNDNNFNNAA